MAIRYNPFLFVHGWPTEFRPRVEKCLQNQNQKRLGQDLDVGSKENKMRKLAIVVFLVGSIAVVPGRAAFQKSDDPANGKGGAKLSTITGCVAQSGALYRLDQAIISTDPDLDTQNRPSPEASQPPKMLSYALNGADVKAHLGHKVEVTGTLTSEGTSTDATAAKGVPGMKSAGTLNVKSVKMVAATCP